MESQYIQAGELVKNKPWAECCDCAKETNDAPEEEIWVIGPNNHIYCPSCAENENLF